MVKLCLPSETVTDGDSSRLEATLNKRGDGGKDWARSLNTHTRDVEGTHNKRRAYDSSLNNDSPCVLSIK